MLLQWGKKQEAGWHLVEGGWKIGVKMNGAAAGTFCGSELWTMAVIHGGDHR